MDIDASEAEIRFSTMIGGVSQYVLGQLQVAKKTILDLNDEINRLKVELETYKKNGQPTVKHG